MEKTCRDAIDEAIVSTMAKCRARTRDEVLNKLRQGDPCIHGYFRYHLLSNLVDCMTSRLKGLRGIYLFGSTLDPGRGLFSATSDINIIIHTKKAVPSNRKVMRALGTTLTFTYVYLLGLDCEDCFSLLDCHFTTDADIKRGRGVAVLIGSPSSPALRLWGVG